MDDEEDESFESPLHQIDEVIFFQDVLTQALQREPQVFQEVQQAMAPQLHQQLNDLMQEAARRRAEEEQEAREEARLNGHSSASPAPLAPVG